VAEIAEEKKFCGIGTRRKEGGVGILLREEEQKKLKRVKCNFLKMDISTLVCHNLMNSYISSA